MCCVGEAPRGSGWASLALTLAPQLLMDDGFGRDRPGGAAAPSIMGPSAPP